MSCRARQEPRPPSGHSAEPEQDKGVQIALALHGGRFAILCAGPRLGLSGGTLDIARMRFHARFDEGDECMHTRRIVKVSRSAAGPMSRIYRTEWR